MNTAIAKSDASDSIQYFIRQASNFRQTGDFEKAAEYLRLSHKLRTSIYPPNSSEVILSNLNLAGVQLLLWDYDSADYYLNLAEKYYESCADCNESIQGNIFMRIGMMHMVKGDFLNARTYYLQALKKYEVPNDQELSKVTLLYLRLADNERNLCDYEASIAYYQKMYPLIQKLPNKSNYLINYYNGLALNYEEQGKYDASIAYKEKALAIARQDSAEFTLNLAILYNNLGNDHIRIGQYKKAKVYLQRAFTILKALQYKGTSMAELYESMGSLYMKQQQYDTALHYLQKGLQLCAPEFKITNDLSNPQVGQVENKLTALHILKSKSECLERQFNQAGLLPFIDGAIDANLLAIGLIEELRMSTQTYESKIRIAEFEYDIFNRTIDLLAKAYHLNQDAKYSREAFRVSERSKSSVLIAALRELDAREFGEIPDSLLIREVRLNKDITFYKYNLYEEQQGGNPDSTKIATWTRYLFDAQREHDQLIRLFEKEFPKYYDLKYDQSITDVKGLQKLLPAGTSLVQYSLSDSILHIFLITKRDFHYTTQVLQGDFTDLLQDYFEKFQHFDFSKQSMSEFTSFCWSSKSLYDYLIEPIEDKLISGNLIIVPDGILSYLPYETLIRDMPSEMPRNHYKDLDYLLFHHNISYAYSSTFLKQAKSNRKRFRLQPILAFAPEYESRSVSGLPPLVLSTRQKYRKNLYPIPGALEEVETLKQLMPADVFIGQNATEQQFRDTAMNYDVLHLAMHTVIDNTNPLYSKLIFTLNNDTEYDGMLNTYEVFGLKLNARMVVLSACSTGEGEYRKGEGVLSLARGFVYAGTPSLIMTMWEVEDKSGSGLMKDFYLQLIQGKTKAEALRHAKISFLEAARPENSHPFFWSSFVILGNPDALYARKYPVYIALAVLLMLFILGIRKLYRSRKLRINP